MALQEAPPPATQSAPEARQSGARLLRSFPQLTRKDTWWIQPVVTAAVLGLFAIFATWRAFENQFYHYTVGGANYLSPFYSPLFANNWHIFGLHFSPALFILPFPLLFRATCYYYRKAYYRAFFWDPPACAVSEVAPRRNYTGERAFPLILQNIHRYAFYFAVIVVLVLWWDTFMAFDFGGHFGVSVGSLIFLVNVVLLSFYTFSCHAWRHLSGGCVNCFSCSATNKARHGLWKSITHWNESHSLWAWLSLFSVVITDLYVRFLCTGAIPAVLGKPF
jgi:hypothetical protein